VRLLLTAYGSGQVKEVIWVEYFFTSKIPVSITGISAESCQGNILLISLG
jgi:hypothetical protein